MFKTSVVAVSLFVVFAFSGCQPPSILTGGGKDYFDYADKTELEYLKTVDPFYLAIVNKEFEKAYDLLSEWATKDVDPNQFMPDQTIENAERFDLTKERFVEEMKAMVGRAGEFKELDELYIESTDPKILSGQVDDLGSKIDVVYAIGMISDKVPTDIRRAAIRGLVNMKFRDKDLEEVMKYWEASSEEELYEIADTPYCKLKTVVVEEDGEFKIAYFEFVPPSMMD